MTPDIIIQAGLVLFTILEYVVKPILKGLHFNNTLYPNIYPHVVRLVAFLLSLPVLAVLSINAGQEFDGVKLVMGAIQVTLSNAVAHFIYDRLDPAQ